MSCEKLIQDQQSSTTWLFSGDYRSTVELVADGEVQSYKPGRLILRENCSLTIKNLTAEDAGLYTCRQFESPGGNQIAEDSTFDLAVVSSEYFHPIFSSPPFTHDHHFSDGVSVAVVFLSHLHLHQ